MDFRVKVHLQDVLDHLLLYDNVTVDINPSLQRTLAALLVDCYWNNHSIMFWGSQVF